MGDFNTPLTSMDRSSRQKINKEMQALNDTLDHMDLIAIYRAFHLKAAEYTFFSSAYGTFSRIDLMLCHKASLGKFKKIEIGTSLGVQWLRLCLPMRGVWVQSLSGS